MPYMPEGFCPMPTQDVRHEQFPDATKTERRAQATKRGRAIAAPKPRKVYYAPVKSSSRFLSTDEKYEIKRRCDNNELHRVIAADFCVSRASVGNIARGKTNLGPRAKGRK